MRRALLSLVLLASAASCTAVRLTYEQADWLLARWAASYVDLDREQTRMLRAELEAFHTWHRREELPKYAALLDEAAARLGRGLEREDVVWAVRSVQLRYGALGQVAAVRLAPMLLTLNDAQLNELEQRFAADNRRFYTDHLADDPQANVTARADWMCQRLRDWTGTLTTGQRQRVQALAQAFPEIPALRLEDRERRQHEMLRLLHAHAGTGATQAQLVAFLTDPAAGRSERYRATLTAWEAQFVDLLLDLDRSLEPRQRANAVARLQRYAAEFRNLAARPAASRT